MGWCIMRDFNNILEKEEKEGGNERSERSMQLFRNFVQRDKLLDLGYVGNSFTWCNRRSGEDCVKMRLDRALCDAQCGLNFLHSAVTHLPMIGADHFPLLLNLEVPKNRVNRRFVFDKRWIKKEGCESTVKEAWSKRFQGSRWFQVCEQIKCVRQALIKWCKRHNFNSRVRIDELQVRIKLAYEADKFDRENMISIEMEWDSAWGEEEVY
ncbi:hypothetical protein LIER_43889 [Lithospermum erythrorhizon]|uniref:Uncharacterized protein n=1 Tax=Lithospermum erythrorhizon TaxID=34254 RepID=A0AAV3R9F2_LITER